MHRHQTWKLGILIDKCAVLRTISLDVDQDQSHFELVYGTLLFHKHTSGIYLMVSPLDTKGCVVMNFLHNFNPNRKRKSSKFETWWINNLIMMCATTSVVGQVLTM